MKAARWRLCCGADIRLNGPASPRPHLLAPRLADDVGCRGAGLAQTARGIGLGAWSPIAAFHELARVKISEPALQEEVQRELPWM